MRRILVVLILLTSALSLWKEIDVRDDADQASAINAAAQLGPSFTVPADKDIADPATFASALTQAARQSHVNVVLTSAGYTADNRLTVTQYALLTGPTKLLDKFELAAGRWPSPDETQRGTAFASSSHTRDPRQVGIIHTFSPRTHIAVLPLASAYANLPVAASYYIESRPGTRNTPKSFLTILADQLTAKDHLSTPLRASRLALAQSAPLGIAAADVQQFTWADYALIVAIGFLSLYRTLALAKRAGVMRLHGFGRFRIWLELHGRLVITTVAVGFIGQLAAAAILRNIDASFAVHIVQSTLTLLATILLATAIAGIYQSRGRLTEQIKNRKDTRAPFYLNALFLTAAGIIVVLMISNVFDQYAAANARLRTVGNWSRTSGYGIFYPTSVGSGLVGAQTGQAGSVPTEAKALYTLLDARGALYVDATQFNPSNTEQTAGGPFYRALTVNPNYLKAYPIKQTDGKPVSVDPHTTDEVLLVPAPLRRDESKILHFFAQERQSTLAAEPEAFGDTVPPKIAHQKIRIVWTAAAQHVFTFDPSLNLRTGNTVTDPIVQVITDNNSVVAERANAITGDVSTALKVKLSSGGAAATLTALSPYLHRLGLSDQLTHLVTIDGYLTAQADSDRGAARNLLVVAILILIACLGLIVQFLAVGLERFARHVAVRRLFGHSLGRQCRELIRTFIAIVALQCAAVATAIMLHNTHARAQMVISLVVLVALESAVLLAGIIILSNRRFATAVKEGF